MSLAPRKLRKVLHLVGVLAMIALIIPILPSNEEEQSLAGLSVGVNGIPGGTTVEDAYPQITALGLVEQEGSYVEKTWKSTTSNVVLTTVENRIIEVWGDRLTVGGKTVLYDGQLTTAAPKKLPTAFQKLALDESGRRLFGIVATKTGERYLVRCGISDGKFDGFMLERLPDSSSSLPTALSR